jgi:hypothetical protein
MKPVIVLMILAARRFFTSEMQVGCGLKDRVQYRDGFLEISLKETEGMDG